MSADMGFFFCYGFNKFEIAVENEPSVFGLPKFYCIFQEFLSSLQSGPQDQKSVIFSRSVISLKQLLQNFKNTANIFLTVRNHVKIFLSQNIMHNQLLQLCTARTVFSILVTVRLYTVMPEV